MKYLIIVLFLIAGGLIAYGFLFANEIPQKFIGSGVALLFLIAFPLFAYYRWKDRDLKDYMLTKENLDKMRENQNASKR